MNQEKIKELEKIVNSDYSNIAGIIVQKNGTKLYENYFNGFTADNAIHIFSATKSVISALIGIAIDKGHIKSVDQKVLDFFPDYTIKTGEKTIQGVTIKNLLTMTASYKYETEPYEEFFASDNWVKAALDYLGGEHTGEFLYTAIIGIHILSGVLAKARVSQYLISLRKIYSHHWESRLPTMWYFAMKKSRLPGLQEINTLVAGLLIPKG